jgi:hypothetical protein
MIEYEDMIVLAGTVSGLADLTNWNPLHDDGDALRLAVSLDLIGLNNEQYWKTRMFLAASGKLPPDALASTRLTILHAAAEIGATK